MRTAGIISLGCPRNLVDSEAIVARLRRKGYRIVESVTEADVAVVNTCAFIDEAKQESIDTILDVVDLKKQGKLKKVIVCGCLAQRYKEELVRQLPEVDAFWGKLALGVSPSRDRLLTPAHYAYLKICEGCVHRCSFCAIPAIKGAFVSLPQDDALARARSFDRQRIAELNIIGQDITGYGVDRGARSGLVRLVRSILAATPHIPWVRLLYLYPGPAVKEIVALMKDEPRLCRYIDMPIQHINSRILSLMRRGVSRRQIEQLIMRIRKALPDAALRTSVIVGFPSETDREFKELLAFMRDVRFERLGAFVYSREEGTPAYAMRQQISAAKKRARFDALMSLQQDIARQVNARFLGTRMRVLIEECEDGRYVGRSALDAPEVDGNVYVRSSGTLRPGTFIDARITDTLEYDLVGEVAS